MVRRIDNGKPADLETLERLDRARSFIDHCYDHPLSLDQLSEKACFSRYHFLRLFREAFNKTPHQYLIERRIEKAKELLGGDELRVTDVCFEVGFQESWFVQHSLSSECRPGADDLPRARARQATSPRMFPGHAQTRILLILFILGGGQYHLR